MRKLFVRYLALDAHDIQMSSLSQLKLSDCNAPRRSTLLAASLNTLHCPQRWAVGQARLTASRSVSLKCVWHCLAMATPQLFRAGMVALGGYQGSNKAR